LFAVVSTGKNLRNSALIIHGKFVVQIAQTLNLVKRGKIKAQETARWAGCLDERYAL
jgi:hypothetical protein